jgi:predicted nuclease with TOPRIM domain
MRQSILKLEEKETELEKLNTHLYTIHEELLEVKKIDKKNKKEIFLLKNKNNEMTDEIEKLKQEIVSFICCFNLKFLLILYFEFIIFIRFFFLCFDVLF